MRFEFTDEEKLYVFALLQDMHNSGAFTRPQRRFLKRIALKFTANSTLINLRPKQVEYLKAMFAYGLTVVDAQEQDAQLKDNETKARLLEKAAKVRTTISSVLAKVSRGKNEAA